VAPKVVFDDECAKAAVAYLAANEAAQICISQRNCSTDLNQIQHLRLLSMRAEVLCAED
jgi:hypothetical protein